MYLKNEKKIGGLAVRIIKGARITVRRAWTFGFWSLFVVFWVCPKFGFPPAMNVLTICKEITGQPDFNKDHRSQ